MKKAILVLLTLITININAQTSLDSLLFDKLNTYRINSGLDSFVFDSSLWVDAYNNTQLLVKYKTIKHDSFPEYPDGNIPISNEEDQSEVWAMYIKAKYKKYKEDGSKWEEEELSDLFITGVEESPGSDFVITMFFNLYEIDKAMLGKSEKEIYQLGVSCISDDEHVWITVLVYLPR